jgi:hypothetical protein
LPNPLGFPDTEIWGTSAIRTATFYNVGQVALNFTQFQMPPDFQIVQSTCMVWIPASETCTISFVFRPTHTGTISEDLFIFIYGNMRYPYVQALIGNGIPRPSSN